ncbi:MAG: RdgB/HAM1 family non-canonical purine NTP pyrophosphatase [Candidatus Cloacimonetes bacterium]|jgi:XTP/dITP diphosphohydrolase|nr:RdgB/HAM1 family non-canonical purine NTP pyrophosphatase [Candidatus Cloacimonadota bacterium]MDY0337595.1 RdgB/HAM1 family non-canonical purine NTP pyrophosphatase [Candidatus Cloacimonadaceae bacterium]MCB5269984.1 RdgB/HAM1 family non-canonical purine NTP pyrophosphatase [Candidatus Cloacimonadota bacterium]MCK9334227.1 RdgB/HAM1 family non-canonical purine NTP pyrophosphatase [Candidatus Cloacimonadota bacterium]MDD2543980.1 RdgB/HAM1 family non-canonical purine NTP pyrophosphatase [Can
MAYQLLLASRNPDKISELRAILEPYQIRIHTMLDFPDFPDTLEDKDSIFGNAMKKALEGARQTGMLCLADDTGLFIDALKGAPGVFSARYAGPHCSYQDNLRKVLLQMQDIPERSAHFETAAALADPSGIISVVSGLVRGQIAMYEQGSNGFGYDSIFTVEGYQQTYAEMDDETKNRISHRSHALRLIIPAVLRALRINDNI